MTVMERWILGYTFVQAFESPDTVNSCADFLRRYVESSAKAAVLVVSTKTIAFPQVWRGQGSRKRKANNNNDFCIQLETSAIWCLWFVASSVEQGCNVCRGLIIQHFGFKRINCTKLALHMAGNFEL